MASTTEEATQCFRSGPLLQRAEGLPEAALRGKFRTLLGPGLRLPPISGSCAVVAGALVVEREASHAQRSGGIARRVELPGDAVARRDVADRRAAVGAEWPAVREREGEIRLDRRRAGEREADVLEDADAAIEVRCRGEARRRGSGYVEADALALIRESAVVPGLRGLRGRLAGAVLELVSELELELEVAL